MTSQATTVDEYMLELPEDRRAALQKLRETIQTYLQPGFEEAMGYGLPGWVVPHSVYPHGYHCDPRQPVPFVGFGSQKNNLALYMFCLYIDEDANDRFVEEWKATGKKLDMGKSCIRFKRIEDVPLEVVARAIQSVSVEKFLSAYERSLPESVLLKRAKSKAKS